MSTTNDTSLMLYSLTNLPITCYGNIYNEPYGVVPGSVAAAAMRFCVEVQVLCGICVLFCNMYVFL